MLMATGFSALAARSCPCRRSIKEVPQLLSLTKHEAPELQKAVLVHFQAGVGLHAPAQVGAAPRRKAMATGCVPEKAEELTHAYEYSLFLIVDRRRRRPTIPRLTCHHHSHLAALV